MNQVSNCFGALLLTKAIDIDEPQLPRKRKVPSRFEIGAPDTYHCSAKTEEFYRQIYFEANDHVINSLANRFDQPDFHTYIKGAMSPAKVYCGNKLFTLAFFITRGLSVLSPYVTMPDTIVSVISMKKT